MATPITWRNVAQAQQQDATRLLQSGSEGLNKAIGGLSRLATERGEQLDADQLNAALAQINNLSTVNAAREATTNDLVGSLGLSAEMQNQARDALRSRINTLQQQNITEQNYNTNQRTRAEAPIRDEIARLADAGNYTEARKLAEGLSDGGRVLTGLTESQRGYDARQTMDGVLKQLQGLPAARDKYRQEQQAGFLSRNPGIADAVTFDSEGNISVDEGSGYTKDFVLGLMQDQNFDFGMTKAPKYEDYIGNIFQNASNLNPEQFVGAINIAQQIRDADPDYQKRQANLARQTAYNEELSKIREEAFIAANPTDPALPPSAYRNRSAFYDGAVKPLINSLTSKFPWEQDYKEITGLMDEVIDAKYTTKDGSKVDYPLEIIQEAFLRMAEVREAENSGGGFGSLNDKFDKKEFKNNLEILMGEKSNNASRELSKQLYRENAARNRALGLPVARGLGFDYQSLLGNSNSN